MDKIQVTKYRKSDREGALIAYFNIIVPKWGNFYINDMKLFQKDGKRWTGMPDRKYEVENETKYAPYCGFQERKMSQSFQDQILKAIDQYAIEQEQKPKVESLFNDPPF